MIAIPAVSLGESRRWVRTGLPSPAPKVVVEALGKGVSEVAELYVSVLCLARLAIKPRATIELMRTTASTDTGKRRRSMSRATRLGLTWLLVLLVLLANAGCTEQKKTTFHGQDVSPPFQVSDQALTTSAGRPFSRRGPGQATHPGLLRLHPLSRHVSDNIGIGLCGFRQTERERPAEGHARLCHERPEARHRPSADPVPQQVRSPLHGAHRQVEHHRGRWKVRRHVRRSGRAAPERRVRPEQSFNLRHSHDGSCGTALAFWDADTSPSQFASDIRYLLHKT